LPGSLVAGAAGASIGVIIALVAMRLVVSAATGVTAAAAAAGIAVLITPHLPPSIIGDGSNSTPAHAEMAQAQPLEAPTDTWSTDWTWPDAINEPALLPEPATAPPSQATDDAASLMTEEITAHASRAWARVPEQVRGQAALAAIACGLLGALLGAVWPARIASVTTAFMGAAIWPIGAIQMQALAGSPISIEAVPVQTWLFAWIVLGMVGLCIQRLVLRKVAES